MVDFLSLKLPFRHRPDTDLMSKHVLLDPFIINSVVETVVGTKAKDNYTPWPTEWTNNTKSDILYVPKNFTNDSLPPVLVEIQHVVDKDFIIRLMDYSISIYRNSKKVTPIVVVFVISSMKYDVSKKTTCCKNLPFLLKYPSDPWARSCYFITDSSIKSSLTLPLTPFVALSEFLIDQHPSLLSNPFYTDSNIQNLYSIATNIFQDQIVKNENYVEEFVKVCNGYEDTIYEVIKSFSEEVPDMEMWPKTKKVLEDAKLLSQANKRKYQAILDTDEADEADDTNDNTNSSTSSSTNNNTNNNTSTSTNNDVNNNTNNNTNSNTSTSTNNDTNNNTNSNWEYVTNYISNINDGSPIPWEDIYDNGRSLGLFEKHLKWSTMKANYYRWKKEQN